MAHIPETARFVNPPARWTPSEDAVTDEAVEMLTWGGECEACWTEGPPIGVLWAEWIAEHALACQPLRDRATARLIRAREDA